MYSGNKYPFFIIDSNPTDAQTLQEQLVRFPYLQSMGACSGTLSARSALRQTPVNLLFLTVSLSDRHELDFIETLPADVQVIVLSSVDTYAIQAFELGVTDYLVKPFSIERLQKAVHRAINRLNPQQSVSQPDYVVLKSGWESVRIPIETINYVEAFGAFCKVHTTGGMILVSDFLSTVCRKLPAHRFIRTHKSYVVASQKVSQMTSKYVLVSGTQVPVGASYRQSAERVLLTT